MTETDPLTAALERWKAATEAATPGPWEAHSRLRQYSIWHDELDQPLAREVRNWDDAVFMSAARTAMPRLVAAVGAVLELAGDAKGVRDYSGPETYGRQVGWTLDPAKVREAITTSLSRKEGSDGV